MYNTFYVAVCFDVMLNRSIMPAFGLVRIFGTICTGCARVPHIAVQVRLMYEIPVIIKLEISVKINICTAASMGCFATVTVALATYINSVSLRSEEISRRQALK